VGSPRGHLIVRATRAISKGSCLLGHSSSGSLEIEASRSLASTFRSSYSPPLFRRPKQNPDKSSRISLTGKSKRAEIGRSRTRTDPKFPINPRSSGDTMNPHYLPSTETRIYPSRRDRMHQPGRGAARPRNLCTDTRHYRRRAITTSHQISGNGMRHPPPSLRMKYPSCQSGRDVKGEREGSFTIITN